MHGLNSSHTTADCRELQSVNSSKYSHQHRDSSRIGNYRPRDYRTENFSRDSYRSQSRSRSRSRDRNFRNRDYNRNHRSPSGSPYRQEPGPSKTKGNGGHYRSFRDFRPPSLHPRLYHTEIRGEDETPRDADGARLERTLESTQLGSTARSQRTTETGQTKSFQIAQHLNIF